jgi:hypothetical protein
MMQPCGIRSLDSAVARRFGRQPVNSIIHAIGVLKAVYQHFQVFTILGVSRTSGATTDERLISHCKVLNRSLCCALSPVVPVPGLRNLYDTVGIALTIRR